MNRNLENKLDAYFEKFGAQFPLMLCMSMREKDIISIINKCLRAGEPYDPDTGDLLF